MRACVRACVCVCMFACVRVCVRVYVYVNEVKCACGKSGLSIPASEHMGINHSAVTLVCTNL